jgi:hypothetical protein
MSRATDEIELELLQLDARSRAALAKSLLDSLETLSEAEYEQLWVEEAEARYADFVAGKTDAIDGDEVLRGPARETGEAVPVRQRVFTGAMLRCHPERSRGIPFRGAAGRSVGGGSLDFARDDTPRR